MNDGMNDNDISAGFRAAIAAEPLASVHRLAFADWLADVGEEGDAIVQRVAAGVIAHTAVATVERLYGWPSGTIAAVPGWSWRRDTETPEAFASRVLAWVEANVLALDAAAVNLRRRERWRTKASAGDVASLLALPESREAFRTLVRTGRSPERGYSVTDFCGGSRKSIAAVKAVIAARERRKADREVGEAARRGPPPGWIAALWLKRLRERAVTIGCEYHSNVRSLYQSRHGAVLYGRGGQVTVQKRRHSNKWHSRYGPPRNLNGGARLDSETRPSCVILENHRGTEVSRVLLAAE